MKKLKEIIGQKYIVFDGGFGSMLQRKGVSPKTNGLLLNITDPDIVSSIHCEYLACGSMCITTNTFGADRYHLENLDIEQETIILAAIDNAKNAIKNSNREAYVLYDISPTGRLLKPLGDISFDDSYDAFKEQVLIAKDKVDGFIIETFSNLHEMKAAILAVKENSSLPVIASCTFNDNGKMLTGESPLQMVMLLEGLGVDMLGVNCSLGPNELMPVVENILEVSTKPLLVQPNAGLPKIVNGETSYDITPEDFASAIGVMLQKGIAGFGGCCGTTPSHIASSILNINGREFNYRGKEISAISPITRVSGTLSVVEFKEKVIKCGERLNPTGKPKLKKAIQEENYDLMIQEGLNQVQNGADILDVNVGVPGVDETKVMVNLIGELQSLIGIPLQIDSSNIDALERACRLYNGIPLINSVNGKNSVMESVFPIVAKYGGVVIGLCIDENGIPSKAEERFEIATRIIKKAAEYGIDKSRIIIDSLVLTASAQQKEVMETIKCVKMVTDTYGIPTCLGLSNVSFGLPNRPLINRTLLVMALSNGLKFPILNPLDKELMGAIDAFEVLNAVDINSESYIVSHSDDMIVPNITESVTYGNAGECNSVKCSSNEEVPSLCNAIISGQKSKAKELVEEMGQIEPLQIVTEYLIPSLDKVGVDYDKGKLFLPQLMMAAETAKLVFEVLKKRMTTNESSSCKGPVMLATVEADVHDIGKNIVKVILESYGYEVIDLGKDVKAEIILDNIKKFSPIAIGLSALMTTTVTYMESTIKLIKDNNIRIPVIVGGAVLSEEVCKSINGDYYAKDAVDTVRICDKILQKSEE